ncbi:hypothetical protein BV898_08047 [Hypsibius exemplaris]|uniref:Invertebrate defensins family profile domain-containing protein n=1 Tax=Hypsibius exemplaris TaxID=2072580 RepID=A0A1W0WRT1_HYPEX|nr:hypothetical protein BV898_08047 [Hypsibius exemplaris]
MRLMVKTTSSRSVGSCWTWGIVLFLALGLCGIPYASAAFGASEGCSRFCRATGFAGVVGNCACGLSLFSAKKRSIYPSRLMDPFGWQNAPIVERSDQQLPAFPATPQEYETPSFSEPRLSRSAAFFGPRIPLLPRRK